MKIVLWSGMVAAMVTGCSSSADLGSFSSSLDSQRTLDGLTTEESSTLCNEILSFETRSGMQADIMELDCRANASVGIHAPGDTSQTDADVRAACKEEYDLCKASYQISAGTCASPPTNCSATVAELVACVNDMFRWTESALADTPMCNAITVAELDARGSSNVEPPQPASCLALAQKCPGAPMP
jgi:hypothetical protein